MKIHYRLPASIACDLDVYDFFVYLYCVESVCFHPDDSFNNYIDFSTNQPCFDEPTCLKYDLLMEQAHKLCAERIYDIGLEVGKATNFF